MPFYYPTPHVPQEFGSVCTGSEHIAKDIHSSPQTFILLNCQNTSQLKMTAASHPLHAHSKLYILYTCFLGTMIIHAQIGWHCPHVLAKTLM